MIKEVTWREAYRLVSGDVIRYKKMKFEIKRTDIMFNHRNMKITSIKDESFWIDRLALCHLLSSY